MSPSASILMQHVSPASDNVRYLALRADRPSTVAEQRSALSWGALLLAVAAHAAVFYYLQGHKVALPVNEPVQPMMVSLLPSPQPQVVKTVPLIPRPVVHKVQPKVEKATPQPLPPVINEPTLQPPPPPAVEAAATPAPAVEPPPAVEAKVEPKPEKVEEPKIEPPRFGVAYLNNPPPAYPLVSKRLGEQGRVILKVLVNANGEPQSVDLETGSGSDRLDQAAMDAVKKWRFVPAKLNGQPLSAYVLVPLKFSLQG